MLDDWLGELAFVHYWRVLEERGSGVTKAPEFTHLSPAERQAWVEGILGWHPHWTPTTGFKMRFPRSYSMRRAIMGSTRDARRAGT